jgi:uncharacterized membrane protein YdjX (TVP38/TMEM64 family)
MKEYKKFLLVGAAILISILIFVFREQFAYLQNWGYLGIFLISLIGNATIVLPVPAFLTTFIGGSVLNPFFVALVSSMGATIGELTGYMAGVGGEEFVKERKEIKKINTWMSKYGLWTIFFLAATPNPIFDLAGMVAGASKIPVQKYLIVVWAGKLIKFLLISYFGAYSIIGISSLLN